MNLEKYDINKFKTLRHFATFLQQQIIDLQLNGETKKFKFMSQLMDYMQENSKEIEYLALRELRKMQILMYGEFHNPGIIEENNNMLLANNAINPEKLRNSSYMAEDLNIENLPLS